MERILPAQIKTIEEILSIYKVYLKYMSRFLGISDYGPWQAVALKNLKRYLIEDDRHIFILKTDDSVIGFALINKHLRFAKDGFAIAEFFIQKKYGKKGYGRKLAEYIFIQYPGNWEIAVALNNHSARKFWKQVLASYTGGDFTEKIKPSFNGSGFLFNNS